MKQFLRCPRRERSAPRMVSSEVKLVVATAGLYSSFLYWGYLQEKITGKDYVSPLEESITGRWHFSFVLNGAKITLFRFLDV